MVAIRPARPSDSAAIVRMARALAAHHGETATLTDTTIARDIFGPAPWVRVLIAGSEVGPLGFVAFTRLYHLPFARRGIEITSLWSDPEYRGQGVGTSLIHACLAAAHESGCEWVVIGAHPDNQDAQKFHTARGFVRRQNASPRFVMQLSRPDTP